MTNTPGAQAQANKHAGRNRPSMSLEGFGELISPTCPRHAAEPAISGKHPGFVRTRGLLF
jgi:hypothetical protein